MITKYSRELILIKNGIWVYFWLLIFEGALRKWFLPFLATPLLVVRDPLVLFILFKAFQIGVFRIKTNIYSLLMNSVGIVCIITALLFGHRNIGVIIFGARILMLHFPFMFLIGEVLEFEDVIKFGKRLIYLSFPMMMLIAIQFYSPLTAWINIGVGGEIGIATLRGAMGYFRPPGTFSFTTGNSLFWGFVGPFVIYFLLSKTSIKKIYVVLSVIALLGAIAFSISRTIFFQILLTICFVLPVVTIKPQYVKNVFVGFIAITLTLLLLFNFSESVRTGVEVFEARLVSANNDEGGISGTLVDRFLGGMVSALTETDLPFFGHGIGMGTNVGSKLLTGEVSFLIAEGEWGRLVGELGLFLGLLVIAIRFSVIISMLKKSINQLKENNILPMLLLSFGLLQVLQGQWGQPTSLGFSILSGGLILASSKIKK